MIMRHIKSFSDKLTGYIKYHMTWYAPPYYRYSILTLIGLQLARYCYEYFRYRIKTLFWSNHNDSISLDLANKGIFVKNDFLSADQFENLQENIELIVAREKEKGESILVVFRDEIAIRIRIDRKYFASGSGQLDALAWSIWAAIPYPEVQKLAEDVNKEKSNGDPAIEIEYISVPENSADHYDHNTWWHADKHFHSGKCFLFVNDHAKENGAYEYYSAKNQPTWARCFYEYNASIRWTFRYWQSFFDKTKTVISNLHQPKVSDLEYRILGLGSRPIEEPSNTLLVSDNMGFHRRGKLASGTKRIQINFTFYDTRPNTIAFIRSIAPRLIKKWLNRIKGALKNNIVTVGAYSYFINEQGIAIYGNNVLNDKRFGDMANSRFTKDAEFLLFKWAATEVDVILDVGANYGQFTLGALPLAGDKILHAFEPNPRLHEGLEHTIKMNKLQSSQVHINLAGASDEAGELSFFVKEDWSGGSTFVQSEYYWNSQESLCITAAVCTLDQHMQDNQIDLKGKKLLIKIDVEGFDLKALLGAKKIIADCASFLIIIELNGHQIFDHPKAFAYFEELYRSLDSGYAIFNDGMYKIEGFEQLERFFKRDRLEHVDVVMCTPDIDPINSPVLLN